MPKTRVDRGSVAAAWQRKLGALELRNEFPRLLVAGAPAQSKMETNMGGGGGLMRVIRPNRQQRAQMRKRAQQLKAEQKRLREVLPKPMKSSGVGAITLRKREH